MAKDVKYSIEEIAKYNAISVLGSLELMTGVRYSADKVAMYRDAMLKDLETGAMERSIKEYDRAVLSTKN